MSCYGSQFFDSWLICCQVLALLLLYLLNRIGQEIIVSSAPLLALQLFDWSSEASGYFMALAGAVVLPLNMLTCHVFADTDDRIAIRILTIASLLAGAAALCLPWGTYSSIQYVVSATVLFGALNAVEGTFMSLLSQIVSPALATSTFNSGLLTTEAGTLGRVLGDLLIAACGATLSGASLVNALFAPVLVFMLFTLLTMYWFHDLLET
jgi:hypothetical protein